MAKPIGTIVHYYDNIGVGVIKLHGTLKVGDTITLKRGETEFSQTVDSLQMDHEQVEKAGKGKEVGLKLAQSIKEGALVTKA
jgi:translation initiation factor IF-2